jgi:hypothetical protein
MLGPTRFVATPLPGQYRAVEVCKFTEKPHTVPRTVMVRGGRNENAASRVPRPASQKTRPGRCGPYPASGGQRPVSVNPWGCYAGLMITSGEQAGA